MALVPHVAPNTTITSVWGNLVADHTVAILAYLESQNAQAGIGTTLTVLNGSTTPALTIGAGRRIELAGGALLSPSATGYCQLALDDAAGTVALANTTVGTVAASGFVSLTLSRVVTPAAGTYTFRLRAAAQAGTVSASASMWQWIRVLDLGAV